MSAASPNTKKTAERASVVFGRPGTKKLDDKARAASGDSCFSGCFGWLMGFPAAKAQEYDPPQQLDPIPPCVPWDKIEGPMRNKVQCVEVYSMAKEGFDDWTNQDTSACCGPPSTSSEDKALFFCVFDGHGAMGHKVSRLAAERLPSHLAAFPGGALSAPAKALQEAFVQTDRDIWRFMGEDVDYSGTTGVAVLMDTEKRELHVGNVGDSRAVLGQYPLHASQASEAKAVALTEDQKPALPEERQRIELHGGFIRPMAGPDNEDVGVERVWESAARTKPGLAVSRSLGDGAARQLGVIAEPVVTRHAMTAADRFLLLGSDGLWDSLGNEQAVQMASKYLLRNLPGVALKALTEAVRREEGGELGDDTTTVLVVL